MASRNGVCERCGGLARIVHHRRYITPQNIQDPSVTLDWANLEALCIDCHNAEHMSSGGVCAPGLAFDAAGNIVPVDRKGFDPPPGSGQKRPGAEYRAATSENPSKVFTYGRGV